MRIIQYIENEIEDFGQCLEEALHVNGRLMSKAESMKRKLDKMKHMQMQERGGMDYRDGYNMQERYGNGGGSMNERGRYSVNMPSVYEDERDIPHSMNERGGYGRRY